MSKICYYLFCGCCCRPQLERKTKTEKMKDLKTLEQITPDSQTSRVWSQSKSPLDVKTNEMTDFYRIPEQYMSEESLLKYLGFKMIGYLDRGSFGTVSEAQHIQTGLKVAVKTIQIPDPLNDKMKSERIQLLTDVKNELYTLQKLRHPHVIRMIQHFMVIKSKHQMTLNIVMQLANGGTLSHMCEKKGPFDEPKCKVWYSQLLSALSYMHREGIAHRDLKQSNILMDDTEDCLISDFGLSRLVWRQSEGNILMSQTFCGTPPYISPEVIATKKDSKLTYNAFLADVWALGVILFKMFDGHYPFGHRTAKAYKYMLNKRWRFSKGRKPSPQLKDIMEKMLEPDPSLRPPMHRLQTHKWIKDVYKEEEEKSIQKLKRMNI